MERSIIAVRPGDRRAPRRARGAVCDNHGMASKRSAFGRDTGLQARMALTLFLLGLLYTVLVAALLVAHVGIALVIVIAGGFFLFQALASDKLALTALGAHEVSPAEAPDLHAIIERLCIQADLPKPRVAHTVADFCERPSAQALGIRASMIATRGFGRSAWMQSRSMIACRSGASAGETSCAPSAVSASLSDASAWKRKNPPATTITIAMPTCATSSAATRTV